MAYLQWPPPLLATGRAGVTIAIESNSRPNGNQGHQRAYFMILPRRTASLLGLFLSTLVLASAALGQPAQPKKPVKYKVELRYRIPSPRDQHVAFYKEMVEHLQRLDFDFEPKLKPFPNPDYEDRNKNMLTGFVAGDKALACLANKSVAALLLIPHDYALPADPDQYVKIRLELYGGFSPERTFTLANQVRVLLKQFDFIEGAGYDHCGYSGRSFTRLVGWIPVEHLKTLLKDLRTQPTGWFTPRLETETLPAPVSVVSPILVTEVLPDPDITLPKLKSTSQEVTVLDKLSPELRALLKDKKGEQVRAEIFLAATPPDNNESWRKLLQDAAPALFFIEGRTGPMVTAQFRAQVAPQLAALPQVSFIRLAQAAPVEVDPALKFTGDNGKALEASGLAALHKSGFKGKGVRIGIIDSDFRGWEEQVRAGKLPRGHRRRPQTHLVDLTTERNFEVLPEPYPDDMRTIGHGTHCALAAALAAPEADFTLIRIDPASLAQLEFVARAINGELALSDHLLAQAGDLQSIAKTLDGFREELIKERGPIMNKFDDEADIRRDYEMLGAVRGWLFSAREWHFARIEEWERGMAELFKLQSRFGDHLEKVRSLKGIQIVSTSLTWNSGYPLGGSSPLSRWFDESAGSKALWFVSVGNTANQTWTGPYRDTDGNGVMEFVPPGTKLPPGLWTPELNFLAWQPHGGERTLELPQGATVRVTVQWREPHDPSYFFRANEPDRYLQPLAQLHLIALYQRDPAAKVLPADDFDLVGRSPLLPQRIDNQPSGATYEQTMEFTTPKAGRYAIRVERTLPSRWILNEDPKSKQPPLLVELTGLVSAGIRPAGVPTLPALETRWELQPRVFVEVMDSTSADKGRVIFRDFSTTQGSIPMLADARTLVAVGAATLAGEPQPYSTRGSPGTLSFFSKPNVLAYDQLQLTPQGSGAAYGASVSTPFTAGMAATLLSAGRSRAWLDDFFLKQSSKVVRLPLK
jgi:subtilisin family serine protease